MDKQNLVILSRWPIRSRRQVLHDLLPPPLLPDVASPRDEGDARPLRWDRPILHAAIELPGGGLLHAINALAARSLAPVEAVVPAERRYSVIHAGRHLLLDHMLASRRLLVGMVSADIHNATLGDEMIGYASAGATPESFHAPLVVEFALAG